MSAEKCNVCANSLITCDTGLAAEAPAVRGSVRYELLLPSNFGYVFSWPCVPVAGPAVSWPLPTRWIGLCYWYHEDERKNAYMKDSSPSLPSPFSPFESPVRVAMALS